MTTHDFSINRVSENSQNFWENSKGKTYEKTFVKEALHRTPKIKKRIYVYIFTSCFVFQWGTSKFSQP